ncbi:leucyl aminopeptidase [Maledivibacter halophilus]|uniref:Probable cytosol aminopeptidase n=1 Tax=Maledivibacter halophilus TaxID=36842 RepID=A0A1T5MJ35_9FIRM|nr:leucyl aminopeptidase [Maledivibacter halophilus]SKC88257.1 leucyl aminopeptidase [Maledivibacter halophilus]
MKITYNNLEEKIAFEGIILPYFEDCQGNYDSLEVLNSNKLPIDYLKSKDLFSGQKNQIYHLLISNEDRALDLVLTGLGKRENLNGDILRKAVARGYKELKKRKVSSVGIYLHDVKIGLKCNYAIAKNAAEAVVMADYKFNDYKTDNKKECVEKVSILFNDINDNFKNGFNEGISLGKNNILARRLVNEPANILTPEELAKRTIELGKEKGFEVEIYDLEKIQELKMEAYLSVAMGSEKPPKFIIMRYTGDPEGETLGLVGKGLTYDSGGLSLKTTKGMVTMKGDMAGAAAVIGAMSAIAENRLKVNVTAVVAACENMISGRSYKPGDIINSMGGKTIFIGNTDAEGRLTLIDAMHYIVTYEKVDRVVDIATLTGAAIHCLGYDATVGIGNNDEFFKSMDKSFDKAGEKIWRMPIFEEYKELLKHPEADLTNTADSPGTITAGMFIGEFAREIPWIHLDIAGTSGAKKEKEYISKGATGVGVRPLYYLAKDMAKKTR